MENLKRYSANIITGFRIFLSFILLFCPKLSPVFYAVYFAAGASDILDGIVARKTNTQSEFGAKLDTLADFIFVAVCMVKLLPIYSIPMWMYIWIAAIVLIKFISILIGYMKQNKFVAVHSVLNKITGGLIFVLPLTLSFIDIFYSSIAICVIATAAAVWECCAIVRMQKSKEN